VVLVVTDPLWGAGRAHPLEGEGGDEMGFSRDLCVCICKKVVCVSIDLTCFYWEVFWGWTFFWELSSFGNFLSLSFFFVLEVTQTHIHIHTHTFTPRRVPRGGGLEGRHAQGELEAHGGSGEEYGRCVRENDGCREPAEI